MYIRPPPGQGNAQIPHKQSTLSYSSLFATQVPLTFNLDNQVTFVTLHRQYALTSYGPLLVWVAGLANALPVAAVVGIDHTTVGSPLRDDHHLQARHDLGLGFGITIPPLRVAGRTPEDDIGSSPLKTARSTKPQQLGNSPASAVLNITTVLEPIAVGLAALEADVKADVEKYLPTSA